MKSSTGAKSSSAGSGGSKSKKGAREREKRKSQSAAAAEKNAEQAPEKGSPTKEGAGTRKYAGIGPDSIVTYAEQVMSEVPTDEVCCGLAEDVSYKLRQVIHDSIVKARLLGRNRMLSSDVDAAFENLSLDRVVGATNSPNFIYSEEYGIHYLDDTIVDLIELAEREDTYHQPSDVRVMRVWNPQAKKISQPLCRYFQLMCFAIVSSEADIRSAALEDIRRNKLIGPISEWFYRFGYFLLSKDITYDGLTLYAVGLLSALEESVVAPQIVSEKQLRLLVRLLMQRMFKATVSQEVLAPMCRLMVILCVRLPLRDFVVGKLKQRMHVLLPDYGLPIITIINGFGKEAAVELLEVDRIKDVETSGAVKEENCVDGNWKPTDVDPPKCLTALEHLLLQVESGGSTELTTALLSTYRILSPERTAVVQKFYDVFQEALIPLWRPDCKGHTVEIPESNWRNIISHLLKSRRSHPYKPQQRKPSTYADNFPEHEECRTEPAFTFAFAEFVPRPLHERLALANDTAAPCGSRTLIVGKRAPPYQPERNLAHRMNLGDVIL